MTHTYLLDGDKIVAVGNDGEPYTLAVVADGYAESARRLLRYAQAGEEAEHVVDRLVFDTMAHGRQQSIPCPVYVPDAEEDEVVAPRYAGEEESERWQEGML